MIRAVNNLHAFLVFFLNEKKEKKTHFQTGGPLFSSYFGFIIWKKCVFFLSRFAPVNLSRLTYAHTKTHACCQIYLDREVEEFCWF